MPGSSGARRWWAADGGPCRKRTAAEESPHFGERGVGWEPDGRESELRSRNDTARWDGDGVALEAPPGRDETAGSPEASSERRGDEFPGPPRRARSRMLPRTEWGLRPRPGRFAVERRLSTASRYCPPDRLLSDVARTYATQVFGPSGASTERGLTPSAPGHPRSHPFGPEPPGTVSGPRERAGLSQTTPGRHGASSSLPGVRDRPRLDREATDSRPALSVRRLPTVWDDLRPRRSPTERRLLPPSDGVAAERDGPRTPQC